MSATSADQSAHMMACMEVWGGNRAISNGVVMPGLDAWVYSRPYQRSGLTDAGGDIHYVTSCATGRITRMIVADVSGHGAPVARAADALRRLMRRHSNYVEQSRLMEAVNREFEGIGAGADETTGTLFATAVVATYFTPTDELSVSNAGHPRPIWYDAGSGRWSILESQEHSGGPSNLPLGVLEGTAYPTSSIRLRPEDMVVFYSDSMIEAQDTAGRQLGQAGLVEFLASIGPRSPEEVARRLLERVAARGGKTPDDELAFDDDVTMLVIRRNAFKPRPSVLLGLLGGVRIAREALRSVLPGALPASFPSFDLRSIGGSMFSRMNDAQQK